MKTDTKALHIASTEVPIMDVSMLSSLAHGYIVGNMDIYNRETPKELKEFMDVLYWVTAEIQDSLAEIQKSFELPLLSSKKDSAVVSTVN